MLNPKKRGPWRSSFNDPTGNPKPQIAPDRPRDERANSSRPLTGGTLRQSTMEHLILNFFRGVQRLLLLWYGMRYGRGGLEQCCDVQSRTQRISK